MESYFLQVFSGYIIHVIEGHNNMEMLGFFFHYQLTSFCRWRERLVQKLEEVSKVSDRFLRDGQFSLFVNFICLSGFFCSPSFSSLSIFIYFVSSPSLPFFLLIFSSSSSQCSMTGGSKAMVHVILSVGRCI